MLLTGKREKVVAESMLWVVIEYFARFMLATIFLYAAIGKFVDTSTIQGFMETNGIPGFLIWFAAATDIAIGISIISGYLWRMIIPLGAVYIIVLGLIFHLRPESPDDMVSLFKNLSLAGAMFLLIIRSKD